MLLGKSVMMPSQGILVPCWLDPENRTKYHFPLFPKPLGGGGGGGGGVGNTISVSFVQKPLGGPSVVYTLVHVSGATTEMPNTPQSDLSFDVLMSYSSWLSTSPACVV